MSAKISIAVVDDHGLFLEGICNLIRQISTELDVSGFKSAKDLIVLVNSGHHFDVIISDLAMKDINGLALIAALRAGGHETPVIIASGVGEGDPSVAANLIRSGAAAFVHKSSDSATLKRVIYSTLGRHHNDVTGDVDAGSIGIKTNPTTLPARQMEVLELMAQGESNRDIAEKLDISENTVKSHISALFAEFKVNKRTACVKRARDLGLV